jgi:hypothetical protein
LDSNGIGVLKAANSLVAAASILRIAVATGIASGDTFSYWQDYALIRYQTLVLHLPRFLPRLDWRGKPTYPLPYLIYGK